MVGLSVLAPNRKSDLLFNKLPLSVKIFCVGGAVRDLFLGRKNSDKDYLLVGANLQMISTFDLQPVGKSFPVFLHPETNEEVALARKEQKKGVGYKGFVFFTNKKITLEEDLQRRDLTVNAMAVDESGKLHDPFNGVQDLKKRILKHVSPAFREDPLRVIRLGRFLSELPSFSVHPSTLNLCKEMVTSKEIYELSKERIWREVFKGLEAESPKKMIKFFSSCGAWKQITGIHDATPCFYKFLETTFAKKVHPKWLAALLFQDNDLKKIKCALPKNIGQLIIFLQRTKTLRNEFIKNFQNKNLNAENILDICIQGGILRNPNTLDEFLNCTFFNHPEQMHFLENCFRSVLEEPIFTVLKQNTDKTKIKKEIYSFRIKHITKFIKNL